MCIIHIIQIYKPVNVISVHNKVIDISVVHHLHFVFDVVYSGFDVDSLVPSVHETSPCPALIFAHKVLVN